jgi:acetyl esterase
MTLHPQARAYLDALGTDDTPLDVELVRTMRSVSREAALAEPVRTEVDHVADVDADGVPCRLYRPAAGAPVALYVHGGGWVLHDLETHDSFCRYLADATGWALLAVDYRLAPEHPYPAPLDDVERAARWLRAHGDSLDVDTAWVAGVGDSAGANLVAGLCVRDPRLLDHQVLLYPVTDRRAPLDPALENAALDLASMTWMWDAYAADDVADRPDVSVARATNLADHPPAVVVTCEHDVLRDQGEAYAAALADAGVPVMAVRALGMIHSFWRQPEVFDAARSTVAAVGAWLDAARASSRTP